MIFIRLNTDYLALPDIAARQLIDAMTVFHEHRRARAEAEKHAGGMYWKRQGGYEYLVKTRSDNRQQRLGPRNADSERTYDAFTQCKRQAADSA